ncbi:MAG: urease accessory protein UreD [Gammaproteobacteria bacterium]|nr:urease accessory protein UreD [Gammaproteobacteria bacterium]
MHGWRASLHLGFAPGRGRTDLVRREHQGPLMVQRPFYPELGVGASSGSQRAHVPAHVYILHPPGGVVGGDALEMDVALATGSHALLTTPASAKLYRSGGATATLETRLAVDPGAVLEWLPQPSIVFDGARARARTRIRLQSGARLLGWEGWALGRPACEERFSNGMLSTDLELWVDERPLLIERQRINGDDAVLNAMLGLSGRAMFATLLATPAEQDTLERGRDVVRTLLAEQRPAGLQMGVSLIGELLVARVVASSLQGMQRALVELWTALRPLLLGRPACAPRIWAT